MLYSEIITVCSQIHIKHINTVWGQNVEFLWMLNLVVHIVTTNSTKFCEEFHETDHTLQSFVKNFTKLTIIYKVLQRISRNLPYCAKISRNQPHSTKIHETRHSVQSFIKNFTKFTYSTKFCKWCHETQHTIKNFVKNFTKLNTLCKVL
jgi:hypothetical protein